MSATTENTTNASEFFTHSQCANKNAGDTTCDMAVFVASHKATLDYLARFGTPLEKAKAAVLIKIAEGVAS